MTTTGKVSNWLDTAIAQTKRQIDTISKKYGNDAAKIIQLELAEMQAFQAQLRQTPDTPIEEYIAQKRKGS